MGAAAIAAAYATASAAEPSQRSADTSASGAAVAASAEEEEAHDDVVMVFKYFGAPMPARGAPAAAVHDHHGKPAAAHGAPVQKFDYRNRIEPGEPEASAASAAGAGARAEPVPLASSSPLALTVALPAPVVIEPVALRDPQKAPEYSDDIYAYWRQLELVHRPPLGPGRSIDISAHMRAILVDWLVEVADE